MKTYFEMLFLPPEIAEEILRYLNIKEIKALRLTCKYFNVLAYPFVFATIHVYLNSINYYQQSLSVLKAVSSRGRCHRLSIGKYVKHLYIHSHTDDTQVLPKHENFWNSLTKSQRRLEKRIYTSLPFMICLKKITWHLIHPIRQHFVDTIMYSIPPSKPIAVDLECPMEHLKLFEDLTCVHSMTINAYSAFWRPRSLLYNLVVNNHDLKVLRIHMDKKDMMSFPLWCLFSEIPSGTVSQLEELIIIGGFTLEEQIPVVHLLNLKVLDVVFGYPNVPWDSLCSARIHLSDIYAHNRINDSLLTYLGSYDGLEQLKIHADHDDAHSQQFYHAILPRHANTIKLLWVLPSSWSGTVWGLDTYVLEELLQCEGLTDIRIPIGLQNASVTNAENIIVNSDSRYPRDMAMAKPQGFTVPPAFE
ncbi:uncharacterized protein EV420DRAFT_854108 [Desarmillaria tabescens]|uniref:F-box domain-containing protein n=1 Tax=Armillaria tabescens TaxID=1929756 RepID=A0AA39JT44_ARMTA|nr:uncharacterized protein EV420DRAFT_854108 [Desarmillaria tabescens]KAK0448328.1 hypothetical protein EV420DRAFT_854108 [Desarmillaria tabescens]